MAGLRPLRAGTARILPAPLLGLFAALLLCGCGASDNDPGPGGLTVGEARALDEAAEMLDARRLPAGAVPPETPTPEETETTAVR